MSNGASNRSFNSDIDPQAWARTFERKRVEDLAALERMVENGRLEKPHDCEWCGRHMRYADQQCGCTSKRPGTF